MLSMRRYRDNITMKQTIDKLQSHYECCGDTSYTDWFRLSWVPLEFVDTSDPYVRAYVHSRSGYKSDDVPFSCCDSASRRPCIRQFIHDNKRHFNYDYQVVDEDIVFTLTALNNPDHTLRRLLLKNRQNTTTCLGRGVITENSPVNLASMTMLYQSAGCFTKTAVDGL